ncbi:hypothetical protein M3Y98_00404500 [Aphelenchoides besseyi]|nr:hypothetical protein M3Y98_00404500 [Aphelenchoides besseyi]KAI6202227.1 hypothetical protein M3Y96_00926000 [Aphelenchoides besseyi]
MFVRQLCFFVVFAIIGLADDHQGFEAQGDSSATLDLSKFDYGNATFQLTGSTLAIGISNPSSEIEDATKATFTFGSCSVVAMFEYSEMNEGNFFWFPNGGGSVKLPAEATYDGSKLSAKKDDGSTIEGSCSSTEFKADGSLAVAVKAESKVPVVLTVKAPFAKEAEGAGLAWYYIVAICGGGLIVLGLFVGGGIWGWKKWGKESKAKVDQTTKNPAGQTPNKTNVGGGVGAAGVAPQAAESLVKINEGSEKPKDGIQRQNGNMVGGPVLVAVPTLQLPPPPPADAVNDQQQAVGQQQAGNQQQANQLPAAQPPAAQSPVVQSPAVQPQANQAQANQAPRENQHGVVAAPTN